MEPDNHPSENGACGSMIDKQTGLPLINWELALENTYDDADLLKELLQNYLVESVKYLKEMRASITSEDAVSLRRSSHTLKSQFRIFGIEQCERMSFEIEKMATDGHLEVHGTLNELETAMLDVEKEVLNYLTGRLVIPKSDES